MWHNNSNLRNVTLATYKSYKLFTKGEIDLPQAALNVAAAGSKALIIGTTTKVAVTYSTGAALSLFGTSVPQVMGQGISSAGNVVSGDWDLGDLSEIGEAVLVVLAIAGTGWAVKKGFDWSAGKAKKFYDWFKMNTHPAAYKQFETLRSQFAESLASFHNTVNLNREVLTNAFGAELVKFHQERIDRIGNELRKEGGLFDNKSTLPSLRYFFLEYALEKQKEIVREMQANLPNTPLGYVEAFYKKPKGNRMDQATVKEVMNFAGFLENFKDSTALPDQLKACATTVMTNAGQLSAFIRDMKKRSLPVPSIAPS